MPARFLLMTVLFGLFAISCSKLPENPLHPLSDKALPPRGTVILTTVVLTNDTTWVESVSPIYVATAIVVPEGMTLTVESNVEIRFLTSINKLLNPPVTTGGALFIEGTLKVEGTAFKPVLVSDPGDGGAIITVFSTGSLDLRYFKFAANPLSSGENFQLVMIGGTAQLFHTAFNYVSLNAGAVFRGSRMNFDYLSVNSSTVFITNSLFARSTATSLLSAFLPSDVLISGTGTSLNVSQSRFNTLFSTNAAFVRNTQGFSSPNFRNNYWAGLTTSNGIDLKISDDGSETGASEVLFMPFLTGSPIPVGY